MLEFWPRDKFQEKFCPIKRIDTVHCIQCSWLTSFEKRNKQTKEMTKRNITAHVFLTAFVALIFTFVNAFINHFA